MTAGDLAADDHLDGMIGPGRRLARDVRASGLVVIGDGDDVDTAPVRGVEDGQRVVHPVRFLSVNLEIGPSERLVGFGHVSTLAG